MGPPMSDTSRDELLTALNPSPAAARREAPVNDSPIIGDRRGWGQWRALVHDLVYDALTTPREQAGLCD